MDEMERVKELKQQGFYCSQIILIQGLELLGKSNPDLVRSMHGLAHGMGYSGEVCGALTSCSVCIGSIRRQRHPRRAGGPAGRFYGRWTWSNGSRPSLFRRYGGIRCEEILRMTTEQPGDPLSGAGYRIVSKGERVIG